MSEESQAVEKISELKITEPKLKSLNNTQFKDAVVIDDNKNPQQGVATDANYPKITTEDHPPISNLEENVLSNQFNPNQRPMKIDLFIKGPVDKLENPIGAQDEDSLDESFEYGSDDERNYDNNNPALFSILKGFKKTRPQNGFPQTQFTS